MRAPFTTMKRTLPIVLGLLLASSLLTAQESRRAGGDERSAPPPPKEHLLPTETFLSKSRQVTFVGERSGEAYYSPDASMVAYQSVRGDCPHYQIFIEKLDGTCALARDSGEGTTTCVHWRPDSKKVLWASTHLDPETYGPPPATGGRYVWDKHPSFDIFVSNPDGTEPVRLTSTAGYDAEGSWSHDGSRIVFTSARDGDLEIYTMAADGSDVRRITNSKGYDGGPFFSPDDKRICFRGFRNPKNERYAHLYVVDADGTNEKQISFDDAVNWAPYWHPNGRTLIYSKGLGGHRNFELYLCDVATATHVRLTRHPGADVLPVFSPDGKQVMWTSTRADGRSQIFVADFRMPTDEEWKALAAEESRREAADRLLGDARGPLRRRDGRPPRRNRRCGEGRRLRREGDGRCRSRAGGRERMAPGVPDRDGSRRGRGVARARRHEDARPRRHAQARRLQRGFEGRRRVGVVQSSRGARLRPVDSGCRGRLRGACPPSTARSSFCSRRDCPKASTTRRSRTRMPTSLRGAAATRGRPPRS
jgi:Tol biopolymer transport system component